MKYRVRLTNRAERDLESIYEFTAADRSDAAAAWFAELAEAVYSLEQYPERGRTVPRRREVRRLLFGRRSNVYQIIYKADKRNRMVTILHIRHGARESLSALDDV